jgi:putative lipoprotein
MALPHFARMTPRLALASLLVIGTCGPSWAWAADADPWFGRDKALHFSFSAAIAIGGYGVASVVTDNWRWRLLSGGASGLAAGVGKEALDASGSGDASWRDLTWDVIGSATGLGLAFLIDWLASPAPKRALPDREANP